VAGLAWAVVGLSSPVLWGLVMAVAAFLPLVGVAAVVVPATFLFVVRGPACSCGGLFHFLHGTVVLV